MSRTCFAIKNTAAGVSSKVITLVLSFVSRTIFIRLLGNEYLGINGLYSEVLSMLSFAELGFGSAMTFALYKPIAENDERTAARLTEYYKKGLPHCSDCYSGFGSVAAPVFAIYRQGCRFRHPP